MSYNSLTSAFNEPSILLEIPGLNDFTILKLETKNSADIATYALSQDYSVYLTLYSKKALLPNAWLGKSGRIIFTRKQEHYLHGFITNVKGPIRSHDGFTYSFCLQSPLARLKYSAKKRVFTNKSIIAIIKTIFAEYDFSQGNTGQFTIQTIEDYKPVDSSEQLEGTDYEYIMRLMAEHGLFFYIEQQKNTATIKIIDDNQFLPLGESGSIEYEHMYSKNTLQVMTNTIKYANHSSTYNGKRLESIDNNKTSIKGFGTLLWYGMNFKDETGGQKLVSLHQESIDCMRHILTIGTTRSNLIPGQHIELKNHPDEHLNKNYIITSIIHSYDAMNAQLSGYKQEGMHYKNLLTLMPANLNFRLPWRKPDITAPLQGKLESTSNQVALDNEGRYTFNYSFDTNNMAKPTLKSPPTHQLQPFAGNAPGIGFHFPNHPAVEVALGFINGHAHQPFIMGALYNSEHHNVVTAVNPSQHIIRTQYGHELCIDDNANQEKIVLATSQAENSLLLDAQLEQPQVQLKSATGNLTVACALNKLQRTEQNLIMQIGKDYTTTIKKHYRLIVKNHMQWQSGQAFHLQSFDKMHFETENGNCITTASKDLLLKTSTLKLNINNNDCILKAENGHVTIEAKGNIHLISKGGHITFAQQGASISLKNGELELTSPTSVTIKGNANNQITGKEYRN